MDEVSDPNARPRKAIFELKDAIRQRARSLGASVENYIQTIHNADHILNIDRAIIAIVMVWIPLLVLLTALSLSPQGDDLLYQLRTNGYS
jgi:hypothetical protein